LEVIDEEVKLGLSEKLFYDKNHKAYRVKTKQKGICPLF